MSDARDSSLADSEYLKLFEQEAEDQLDVLESGLLALESGTGDQHAEVEELFRASHTLKGAAATLGFEELAELTHLLENVFQQVRDEGAELSSDAVSVLLACVDTLRLLKDAALAGQPAPQEYLPVKEQVSALANTLSAAPSSQANAAGPADFSFGEYEKALFRQAEESGVTVAGVRITLAPDCQLKSARVALVFRAAEQFGEILAALPPAEELENEAFEDQFLLVLATNSDLDEVARALGEVLEVEQVELLPWRKLFVPPVDEETAPGERRSDKRLAPDGFNRRVLDLGAEARGKPPQELLKLTAHKVSSSVRVDTARLDRLAALAGELVVLRSQFARMAEDAKSDDHASASELVEASRTFDRLVSDLQDEVMATRMLPMTAVFERLPRLVRDLARNSGKQVNLTLLGKETELDRSIIERLGDPLVHLLRNAVDHGIEPASERTAKGKQPVGQLVVSARHHEGNVIIEVSDDGRGIDAEKLKRKALAAGLLEAEAAERLSHAQALNLIFLSGLSTKDEVSEISGRGVGMDVVKFNVEQLNGSIEVVSELDAGTTFRLRFPLTLAVLDVLLVKAAELLCALPVRSVVETLRINADTLVSVQGLPALYLRGEVIPLYDFRRLTAPEGSPEPLDHAYTAILLHHERKLGLVVSDLIGREEIVVKPLAAYFERAEIFSGSCVLGDGSVGLIVDTEALFSRALLGKLTLDREPAYA